MATEEESTTDEVDEVYHLAIAKFYESVEFEAMLELDAAAQYIEVLERKLDTIRALKRYLRRSRTRSSHDRSPG